MRDRTVPASLQEHAQQLLADHAAVRDIPSLEQWSKRGDAAPTSMAGCGGCGARVLIDTSNGHARCSAGCGWTGVVLRRLP